MKSPSLQLLLAAILGSAVAACSTDVGDQACTEESIERDRDDDCPYGPPGGPSVQIAGDDFCSEPPVIPAELPAACATEHTFASVFAIFLEEDIETKGGGKCMNAACHGVATIDDTPKFPPAMVATNALETHKSLQSWGLATYGRPYIRDINAGPEVQGKPEEAWILCNLTALRGKIMPSPSGFKSAASLEAIKAWVDCGMQAKGDGQGGAATGGAGGVGGAGGAGDVGGLGGIGGDP